LGVGCGSLGPRKLREQGGSVKGGYEERGRSDALSPEHLDQGLKLQERLRRLERDGS